MRLLQWSNTRDETVSALKIITIPLIPRDTDIMSMIMNPSNNKMPYLITFKVKLSI